MTLALVVGCAPQEARSPSSSGTPDEKLHEIVVRRYFDEVWSQGRLEVLDELLAPGYVNHTPSTPDPPPGPGGLKPIVAAFRVAFPDLHFTIEDLFVKGDRVAVRVRMEGTQDGPLFGIAATHRRVSVEQINIELFRGGKIVEHWRVTDELGLMRQLGVVQ
ncbi:ester cyclase [Sorangium sp. So ce1078]|uniref:ester cyclase n=1 Tax=Sorangium sp. So ce1078 TaxID=3133329 RepID=UPI003F62060A